MVRVLVGSRVFVLGVGREGGLKVVGRKGGG